MKKASRTSALALDVGAAPLRILCLGAHADDIEIGCGGTILQLLRSRRSVHCNWVVFSGRGGPREGEARASATLFLKRASRSVVEVYGFRDGYFPHDPAIKDVFEDLKRRVSPDVVFTHSRDDRHQDHRVISDLAWNTFRRHMILEYEIPKYDGDLGQPNLFVPVGAAARRSKIRFLLNSFGGERRSRSWFTADTFEGLMRLRGVESGSPEGFAEAFYARKAILAL